MEIFDDYQKFLMTIVISFSTNVLVENDKINSSKIYRKILVLLVSNINTSMCYFSEFVSNYVSQSCPMLMVLSIHF